MYKRLEDFQKKFNKLKVVNPQTGENKNLQENVLNKEIFLMNLHLRR